MDVQVMHSIHHAVGKHQQCRAMKMRDHEQQDVLVAELGQDAAFRITKIFGLCISNHDERTAGAQETGVGSRLTIGPETVVTVTRLKLRHIRIVRRHCFIGMQRGDQTQAQPAFLAQTARIIHRQKSHQRHAVIFDLAITQDAFLIGRIEHQRAQQKIPVTGNPRRTMLARVGKEFLLAVRIRRCQHCAIRSQPLGTIRIVFTLPVPVPARRIGSAEPVKQVACHLERQVAGR